jgi:hypothetical protein
VQYGTQGVLDCAFAWLLAEDHSARLLLLARAFAIIADQDSTLKVCCAVSCCAGLRCALQGAKYVIRTDVLYMNPPKAASDARAGQGKGHGGAAAGGKAAPVIGAARQQ